MVVLNPGVQVESVIATSLSGHLSCTITNAQGQLVVASSSDGMLATCKVGRGVGRGVARGGLAQPELTHPLVVRLLQPVEERPQLTKATRPGHHQVDQLVVVGQHKLGLSDRLAK